MQGVIINQRNREELTREVTRLMLRDYLPVNDIESIKRFERKTKVDMMKGTIVEAKLSQAQVNRLLTSVTIREVQKYMRKIIKADPRNYSNYPTTDAESISFKKSKLEPKVKSKPKIKGPKETFREFVGDNEDLECLLRDSLDNIQTQSDIKDALEDIREELKSGDLDDDEEGLAYDLEDELVSYAEYLKK